MSARKFFSLLQRGRGVGVVDHDASTRVKHLLSNSEALKSPSSAGFNTAVIKLAARLLSVRNEQLGLEFNILIYLQDPDPLKVERFLIHWLLTGKIGILPKILLFNVIQYITLALLRPLQQQLLKKVQSLLNDFDFLTKQD